MSRSIFTLPLLAALALASGCTALPQGAEDEATGTSSDALSLLNWWATSEVIGPHAESYRGAQVATLDGVTYMVHSGRCGSWTCGGAGESKEIWWSKLGTAGWGPHQKISGQSAAHKVSLAAFNGYLYMIHSGSDDGSTDVWLSRFSPASQTWSANYRLSYSSKGGPPAIAAFGSSLRFVGVNPANDQLWMASMDGGEVFTPAQLLSGQYSVSRVSLAVFGTKTMPARLFMAHRAGATSDVVYNSFNGASWGADLTIPVGPAGAALQATEPVLASSGSYLHLIHRRPGSDAVWWTYFDGTSWPSEITLGTRTTTYDPSLATTSTGMVLITTTNDTWNTHVESRYLWSSLYTAPLIFFPTAAPAPTVVSP